MSEAPYRLSNTSTAAALVTPDAELGRRLEQLLSNSLRTRVDTVPTSLSKINGSFGSLANSELLLLELDLDNAAELEALHRVVEARNPDLPIIVVTESLAAESLRQLLQLHITDWLPKNASDGEFLQACFKAIESRQPTKTSSASCIAFFPAQGGVGNTTLAIASAFLLRGKRSHVSPTCIADLNFQSGMVADYLDLQPNLQLGEIAASPDRVDQQMLQLMLSKHRTGLSILAAPQSLCHDFSLDKHAVTAILDVASNAFENIVIDLPAVWTSWTESILLGADKVFLVTDLSVPGLRQAKRKCDALLNACGEAINLSVLVNKCSARMFGAGLKAKDAEVLFAERLGGTVSDCSAITREAIDRGVPLSEVSRSNRIEKDLSVLLSDFTAQH